MSNARSKSRKLTQRNIIRDIMVLFTDGKMPKITYCSKKANIPLEIKFKVSKFLRPNILLVNSDYKVLF
jgi:hypothetical protein